MTARPSLWRRFFDRFRHPQQVEGERMLDAAGIDWCYSDNTCCNCEFCGRRMAYVWPKEIRTSPMGEAFVRDRRDSTGDACPYCRYVDRDHSPPGDRRISLETYCAEHKFPCPSSS